MCWTGSTDMRAEIDIDEHYVDTGGASDHLFSLFTLGEKRPWHRRPRNLKELSVPARLQNRRGLSDPQASRSASASMPPQSPRAGTRRCASASRSSTTGLAPSTVLEEARRPAEANVVSRALREIGRIERTLFMIEWYSRPELRDRRRVGLNKGEAGNKLARAVFFHERGEIRDGSFESQAFRASGLNLVVSAIVLWNTAYLSRAVESLRAEGHELPDDLIRHISPQIWEHINLTGIYDWRREPQPKDTYRPLRMTKEKFSAAA